MQKVTLSDEDRAIVKKQTKRIIIMGIVLAVLVAAYFILTAINKAEQNKASETEEKVYLSADTESITDFSYTYNGSEYSFKKVGEEWVYLGDESMDMKESMISLMINSLGSIEYGTILTDVSDYEQYGLSSGYDTVKWTSADGSYELKIGDVNDITGKYYIQDAGNMDICTVNEYTVTIFHKTPEDLKEDEAEETGKTEEATETEGAT
ncbi:MAG: DUF4340 domain-containing protein [Lachnospiraceae bacterium]|nr:DUF4340 domain-containing protein [Lachnospiraceae bacterium]